MINYSELCVQRDILRESHKLSTLNSSRPHRLVAHLHFSLEAIRVEDVAYLQTSLLQLDL